MPRTAVRRARTRQAESGSFEHWCLAHVHDHGGDLAQDFSSRELSPLQPCRAPRSLAGRTPRRSNNALRCARWLACPTRPGASVAPSAERCAPAIARPAHERSRNHRRGCRALVTPSGAGAAVGRRPATPRSSEELPRENPADTGLAARVAPNTNASRRVRIVRTPCPAWRCASSTNASRRVRIVRAPLPRTAVRRARTRQAESGSFEHWCLEQLHDHGGDLGPSGIRPTWGGVLLPISVRLTAAISGTTVNHSPPRGAAQFLAASRERSITSSDRSNTRVPRTASRSFAPRGATQFLAARTIGPDRSNTGPRTASRSRRRSRARLSGIRPTLGPIDDGDLGHDREPCAPRGAAQFLTASRERSITSPDRSNTRVPRTPSRSRRRSRGTTVNHSPHVGRRSFLPRHANDRSTLLRLSAFFHQHVRLLLTRFVVETCTRPWIACSLIARRRCLRSASRCRRAIEKSSRPRESSSGVQTTPPKNTVIKIEPTNRRVRDVECWF